MKRYSLYILLLSILSFGLMSCEKDVNDWDIDGSHDRLFRTSLFEVSNVQPTSVELKFKGINNATKYVFEFSEGDSLAFTNIIRTVEIPADSLELTAGKAPAAVEFTRIYENLKGTMKYSVRMKGVNETTNVESVYSSLYFRTPDEQIFTKSAPATNKVVLTWIPTDVTHILYWDRVAGQMPIQKTLQLTAEQKAAGQATITDLVGATTYTVQINNNDARRGSLTFTTLGIKDSDGHTIRVNASDTIDTILAGCVAAGDKVVSLVFDGSQAYEIGKITIPSGISALYLVGDATDEGVQPELFITGIAMTEPVDVIILQNVDLNSRLNSANYVFDLGTANCFKMLTFESCTIRNIGRSLVRINNDKIDIDYIRINNCIIKSVGVSGYGMVNMGKNIVKLGELSITNSTVTELGSDRLMQLQGGVNKLIIDKTTFCNYTSKSTEIFRFDKQPGSVSVTNSIFAGNNNEGKINAGKADYSGYLAFSGCYLTSDLIVNTIAFTNATILTMTSEELFADPRNGDFHLKEGVSFAGAKKAGDPRWW